MLTNREFHLQTGNLAYKTGFSFTKRESWVTKGILGLLFTLKSYMREENESNNSVLASMIADVIQKMTLVCQNDIYIGDKKTVSALTNLILKNVSNKMLNAQGAKG